jgi:serine-type D-Ala-D-Ala carboxypeptidase/endopeptidase (penicillin-binding protein 4)
MKLKPTRITGRRLLASCLSLVLAWPVVPMATPAVAVAAAPQQRSSGSTRRTARKPRTETRTVARPEETQPRSVAELASALDATINTSTRSGDWGVMVTSLTRGDTLFSVASDRTMLPASTLKLFTAALALQEFGPSHRFSTDVLRDGPVREGGILSGNIYIRGAGDPAFSNRYERGQPYDYPVRQLARQVAAAGIKRIRGDVIGDATLFESRTIPEGWLDRYLGAAYAARVSALSLNENVVWVAVTPTSSGNSATVVLEPSSSAIPVSGRVRTTGGRGASVSARRNSDGSISVGGSIGASAGTRRYGLVVEDPASFTTGAFRDALAKEGIVVDGRIMLGATPGDAEKIASHLSPPLEKLVSDMNRESINHFAELLFRNAAHHAESSQPGSAQTGNALLQRTLSAIGAAPGSVHAADGSGLSTGNRMTSRAMIHLLAWAHETPWASAFHASLPVAGQSELLRNRMRGSAAAGNLHAKTGTTNDVIGLAGYVTAANGEVLAFSFLYNGNDRAIARSAMDRMGITLATFSRQETND